ncbi:hypothetical protein [Gemmata massiliana]|nr:hypothetical protein [Gemmata massiliana]
MILEHGTRRSHAGHVVAVVSLGAPVGGFLNREIVPGDAERLDQAVGLLQ